MTESAAGLPRSSAINPVILAGCNNLFCWDDKTLKNKIKAVKPDYDEHDPRTWPLFSTSDITDPPSELAAGKGPRLPTRVAYTYSVMRKYPPKHRNRNKMRVQGHTCEDDIRFREYPFNYDLCGLLRQDPEIQQWTYLRWVKNWAPLALEPRPQPTPIKIEQGAPVELEPRPRPVPVKLEQSAPVELEQVPRSTVVNVEQSAPVEVEPQSLSTAADVQPSTPLELEMRARPTEVDVAQSIPKAEVFPGTAYEQSMKRLADNVIESSVAMAKMGNELTEKTKLLVTAETKLMVSEQELLSAREDLAKETTRADAREQDAAKFSKRIDQIKEELLAVQKEAIEANERLVNIWHKVEQILGPEASATPESGNKRANGDDEDTANSQSASKKPRLDAD